MEVSRLIGTGSEQVGWSKRSATPPWPQENDNFPRPEDASPLDTRLICLLAMVELRCAYSSLLDNLLCIRVAEGFMPAAVNIAIPANDRSK